MRSFIKYLSYSLVYLVFMVASAYGAITISMNNSANQQSILPGGGTSSSPALPKQITSIVENITTTNAIELGLAANIDSEQDDYYITLNTTVDLSKGFENISAEGVLTAVINPAVATFSENSQVNEYVVNFLYQNGKVYLDMFNGKISVDTNNILQPITQILEILNIQMPDMGAMDMSSMEINDILSLLSDLTETKNDDGTINLDINIEMIGTKITLICDENYNIQEVVLPEFELEGMKITTDLELSYPENVQFQEKNDEDYIESSNLLNVVNAVINHFNTDAVAFNFDVNYQNNAFNGKAYADINNVAGKITLDVEGYKIDLIITNESIYLEYQNVFVKFDFKDIDKINTLLKDNFGIEIPIDAIKNGDFSSITNGDISNFNPNDIDLSIVEKCYVEGDKTIVLVKEIGEISVFLQENSLKSISFNGFGLEANLEAIKYLPFELQQPMENYINFSDLLPTIDNAISIAESRTISGVATLTKGEFNLPINFLVNNENSLFVEVWTEIKGNIIKLNYIDNKIYLDCAGKFKTLIEVENLSDQIIDFLTGLDVTINTEGLEEIAGVMSDILNAGINPLLIKELTQTANGFNVVLFNDLSLNLVNGKKSVNISTNVEELDVNIQINGSDMEVIIPTFNDSEYNTMESIFDLTKAFINSGMLNVTIGALNYLQEGTIGININAQYQENNFTGKLFADIENMKVDLKVNYQGENLNFFVINNIVYLEYRNIYLQLAFKDLGQIDNLLTTYFNIDLPFEVVGTLLSIAQSSSIEDAINKISSILGDSMNDFVIDLSVIDIDFFNNIKVKGNDTIIPIGENIVTVTVVDEILTNVSFNGLIEANAEFVSYVNSQLATSKENYINLVDFIPTIENAIEIANSSTISGEIIVESQSIYYTISKSEQLYAEVWTEINGYKISMQYLDGKAYFNFADKFKLMSVVENLPTAIEEFVNEINLEFGEIDSEKLNETLSAIINPNLYPLLIKGLIQTENGFILTLFNDFAIELTNGNKVINACTNVQGYSIKLEIIGSEAIVVIPTINDDEYNTVENLLDIVKGFVNSGLLDVSIGAFNYFRNLTLGLKFDVEYQGYALSGNLNIDIENKKVNLSINYQGEKITFFLTNQIVYIEYRNIYLKFAFEDLGQIDNILTTYFDIDLPFEIVATLLKIAESESVEDAINEITYVIGDFVLDLSVIDIEFFDKITVEGNNTIINLGENIITILVVDELLSNIQFSGMIEANAEFVTYINNNLTIQETSYIDLADFIPTVENAIQVAQSNTINGNITVENQNIYFTLSKSSELYTEIWTEIEGYKISMKYLNGKLYLNAADKFKLMSVVENLPTAIESFLNELNLEFGEIDTSEISNTLMDIIDVSVNPLLIKELTQTNDGFIITLFNDISITLANSSKTINVNTSVEGYDINVEISGNDSVVTIPAINDDEFNTVENLLDIVKGFVNSGLLDVSIGALNYFKNLTLGLELDVEYQGYSLTGTLYVDVQNMRVSLNANFKGENINFFVIDQVVYVEFRNIYLKFALEDLGQIDNILTNHFNIDLPFETITNLLKIAQSGSIDDAVNEISSIIGDEASDFVVDLSVINIDFFNNITRNGNEIIIPVDDNLITVTLENEILSKLNFTGLINANVNFVDYQNVDLTVEETSYINLADFIPTVENAIQVAQSNTINGNITVENQNIYFTLSKSSELYTEIWTEIEGYKISMKYLNGKLYLNAADKFKLMSVVENLPTAIESFLNELNLEFGEIDTSEISNTLMDIIDVSVNPLLIKELTQTNDGFIITLFNDISITLANSSKTINVNTSVEGYDINVEISGNDSVVTIPAINDDEFNTVENLLDIVKGFVNSGLLDVSIGALNYFKNLTLGLELDVEYQGYSLTGTLYVDVQNMRVSLNANFKGENINFFVIDQVVYVEFRNIYLKFALEDLGQIDNILTNHFNIDLPFETITNLLKIAQSGSIDDAVNEISSIIGDEASDFVVDLSVINIDFFNNITRNGNEIIIPVDDNLITVTLENEILSKLNFTGLINANVNFVDYQNVDLTVEETSYINLADFIPTVENAIQVAQSNTINGNITVENQNIYFTLSKSSELYTEIWTEIEGYKISMKYLNGKLYLNAADKFKLMSVVENLPTAIESFLNELNLEFGEIDTSEISNTLMDIIDVSVNPLLIKELTQTNDGFIITLFNDISITLANSSKTINVNTSVEGYDINVEISGNDSVVTIPAINDDEFNTVENLLDIVKGFVNSGLLDVSIGAFNYFKNLTLGLELDVEYKGYEFEGTIYFDLQAKKLYINALYDGNRINVAVMNEIFYIELGNILMKYSANNIGKIDEIANTYFGVDLPLEIVDDLLVITRCTTLEEVMTEIQNIFDIEGATEESKPFDLSIIDVNFFDTITNEGNNTIIPVGENTITVTVDNEILTNLAFNGLFKANAKFIPYTDCTVNINDSDFIDLADLIPTVENGIAIVQSETISGQLTIVDGDQTYPIDFVISKDGDYAEFKTVVYQANLSVQYHAGKVYICFANHINLVSKLEDLPDAINKLTAGTESETNISIEEQNSYIDMLYDLIDPDKNPLLFTEFTQTANGFIISIFNGVTVTVDNSTNRIDVSTVVNGISIDGYIIGSDSIVTVPTFDDSLYIPIENIFNFVGAIKNMSKETDFHIAGNMNIDGDLIGIGIDWVVPFDIKVKIVDGKLEAMASIGPIPTMVGVNNDVPYKADDTNSGKDRILKVYIKDNDIYMHRREEVGQFFGGGRIYEKCTKISVDSFFADPMYYMQYALGFTDSIMGAIDDAIQKSANRSAPINLNNIIKAFEVDSTGNNLTIALNMAEIANNELLDVLTLNIALGKNSAGEDIISNVGLSIYMPLAEGIFTLTLTSNDIHFVNYGSPVDMTELYNYVNNYKYKYDEEWEASDGDWVKASSVLYTIIFEENGGNEIANISQIHSSPITLPTPSAIITDNGTYQSTKTFAGWYTTSTFDEGTLFTSTTMPRKDTTLYAKWTEEIRYYRTISFVTNSTDTLNNVVALEGSNITLPSLGIKSESDGITTTHYTFDGWYYDSALTNAFTNYIMPSEDTTLYAKWLVADVETARLLQIYDNNDVIFTRYILADETIDLSGVAKYTAGSTQLYYDAGYATIYDGSFIMPDSNLNLYVRNKYTYVLTTNQTGSVVEISRGTYWQNEPISVPTPENYYTDDGTQTSRVYYTFTGYTINGIAGNAPSVMTNYDLTLCQTWSNQTKFYYSVDFDLRWYLVFGCTEGSEMKDKPTPLNTVKVLDGETLNLTPYQPTCTAYKTAVKTFFGKDQAKPFKATTWGTSPWDNYTSGGKGVTSIIVTENITLYACWEQQ